MGPSDALDGTVQFADNPPFDYDRSDGITPGSYDFYGTVAHEFSEVMGRELNAIGNEVQTGKPDGYYPFDLFKFSAAGVRAFVGTTEGYFSPDGGVTNLDGFNANAEDDFGDWASSAGNDSFRAFSASGVVNAVTPTDVVVMDVIGWDAAPGASALVALVGHGAGGVGPPRRRRRGSAQAPHAEIADASARARIRSVPGRDRPLRGRRHRPLHARAARWATAAPIGTSFEAASQLPAARPCDSALTPARRAYISGCSEGSSGQVS